MGMTIKERIAQLVRVKHYASPKHYETLDTAIETCVSKTIDTLWEMAQKYQQLQADYENRLKADMVAMLTEIQLEINEIPINADNSDPFRLGQASAYDKCENLIQQKIDKLKADQEGKG